MAQITINRISGYSNKLRKIKLVLDNQVKYKIKDGEDKTINVNPGKHILKAKIDWCQSNEIKLDIKEGENKNISLKGTNPFLALYYITFGRNKYLKLEIQN
ncbi:hypothetical protein [Psychroflexus aestuariivivens]|uniref:hypothetical protein n=1 Tax=Psychroflexus aestuariivivens TaxID=1795040 RepID=UPI000FD8628C|nr:hypothetical protein [Psychroflexus aestuariivivens]